MGVIPSVMSLGPVTPAVGMADVHRLIAAGDAVYLDLERDGVGTGTEADPYARGQWADVVARAVQPGTSLAVMVAGNSIITDRALVSDRNALTIAGGTPPAPGTPGEGDLAIVSWSLIDPTRRPFRLLGGLDSRRLPWSIYSDGDLLTEQRAVWSADITADLAALANPQVSQPIIVRSVVGSPGLVGGHEALADGCRAALETARRSPQVRADPSRAISYPCLLATHPTATRLSAADQAALDAWIAQFDVAPGALASWGTATLGGVTRVYVSYPPDRSPADEPLLLATAYGADTNGPTGLSLYVTHHLRVGVIGARGSWFCHPGGRFLDVQIASARQSHTADGLRLVGVGGNDTLVWVGGGDPVADGSGTDAMIYTRGCEVLLSVGGDGGAHNPHTRLEARGGVEEDPASLAIFARAVRYDGTAPSADEDSAWNYGAAHSGHVNPVRIQGAGPVRGGVTVHGRQRPGARDSSGEFVVVTERWPFRNSLDASLDSRILSDYRGPVTDHILELASGPGLGDTAFVRLSYTLKPDFGRSPTTAQLNAGQGVASAGPLLTIVCGRLSLISQAALYDLLGLASGSIRVALIYCHMETDHSAYFHPTRATALLRCTAPTSGVVYTHGCTHASPKAAPVANVANTAVESRWIGAGGTVGSVANWAGVQFRWLDGRPGVHMLVDSTQRPALGNTSLSDNFRLLLPGMAAEGTIAAARGVVDPTDPEGRTYDIPDPREFGAFVGDGPERRPAPGSAYALWRDCPSAAPWVSDAVAQWGLGSDDHPDTGLLPRVSPRPLGMWGPWGDPSAPSLSEREFAAVDGRPGVAAVAALVGGGLRVRVTTTDPGTVAGELAIAVYTGEHQPPADHAAVAQAQGAAGSSVQRVTDGGEYTYGDLVIDPPAPVGQIVAYVSVRGIGGDSGVRALRVARRGDRSVEEAYLLLGGGS